MVAEEHLVDGGLGVRVAQVVAETSPCPMEFVGIQNTYAESGTPEQLLDKYGLIARDVIGRRAQGTRTQKACVRGRGARPADLSAITARFHGQ